MISLPYELNMYPGGLPTVVHVNQYDDDFSIIFTLVNTYGTFTLQTGTTAELRGTKKDGNGYSADCTIDITNSKVTVTGAAQMTAVAGQNTFEIVLKKSNKVLSTANFILDVEPAAMDAGTITSDTVLKELNAIIAGAAEATQAAEDASDAADRAEAAAETLEIDDTLTQEGQAADAKAAGDEIDGLKSAISESLSFKGRISTTYEDAVYTDVDDIFEYGMFAVFSDADNIPVAQNGTLLVMPVGLEDRTTGLYKFKKIQMFVSAVSGGDNTIWIRYTTNSYTWSSNWTKLANTKALEDGIFTINAKPLYASGFTSENFEAGGISSSGGNSTNSKRIRTKGYVNVESYDSIHYSINTGYRIFCVFFSTNASGNNIEGTGWIEGSGTYIFPKGTRYLRMQYASVGDATALTVNDYNKATIQYGTKLTDTANDIVEKTKWLALGDSITYGIYSTGASTEVTDTHGWVERLADSLGYDLTIMASRGMGYTITGVDPVDPTSDRITIDTLLSRTVALTDDYNLITMCFGINDYNSNGTTLAAIKTSLSNAIDMLLTRFPKARMVVITPLNCAKEGSASTKYAYGATHASNTYTLKDLADAIKETCDSYGVECIYATDGFLLNTKNITTLLPDGVHPSYYAHTLIAKNMAHFLLN